MKKRKFKLDKNKRNTIVIVAIIIAIVSVLFIKYNLKKEENLEVSSLENTIENDNEVIEENVISNEIIENEIVTNDVPLDSLQNEKVTEQKEAEKNKNQNFNDSKYYIKVNNQCNVVTIYKNESGIRTPLKAMTCSIGTATPKSGVYRIPARRFVWGTLFGHGPYKYVYGHYVTTIVGNILFHSVPYTENGNPASLEYLEYNKLGTKASAGCVRLAVKDSKWIYYNIPDGTPVEFYSDSNPGPLGKPPTTKIPVDNEKVRNWDPTDDDKNNPWLNEANLNNKADTKPKQANNTEQKNNSEQENAIKQSGNNENNTDSNKKTEDNTDKDSITNEKQSTDAKTDENNEEQNINKTKVENKESKQSSNLKTDNMESEKNI